jgi:hypothetical protein
MADDLTLSLDQARRLAVRSQHLAGLRPAVGLDGMRQVLRGLRMLDILWKQGIIMVAGRDGLRRLWSLADFPAAEGTDRCRGGDPCRRALAACARRGPRP